MADQDLAATGKDVKLELLVNGIPQKIIDQVVRSSERPVYLNIETRHLGSSDVDIEREPDGWEGELEISRKSPQIDDFIGAYNLARRNRVPILVTLTTTTYYRDGSSRTYVHPDIKPEFSTEASRGANVTTRITWRSGVERI